MAVEFQFDFDRALAAMVCIAIQAPRSLDTYKMCKLVFLADKIHLVRYSRPITGDSMCAMEYGPVPSSIYNLLKSLIAGNVNDHQTQVLARHLRVDKSFQYPRFSIIEADLDLKEYLSNSDMRALDEVVVLHGSKSFDELKALTHEMPSWKNAWNNPEKTSKNPSMTFEDLFLEDSDTLRGSQEEMLENFELRKAFGEPSLQRK
jgi:uncharacterized phage-associated protein